ncbi:hypothetical protein KKF61_04090 [Patescibacteria group bacterium]|nr:hypothetical protein [Patescibacteria group bacterium]MBU0963803.1 hypothetical protein [Patescibacteria group bacterium]
MTPKSKAQNTVGIITGDTNGLTEITVVDGETIQLNDQLQFHVDTGNGRFPEGNVSGIKVNGQPLTKAGSGTCKVHLYMAYLYLENLPEGTRITRLSRKPRGAIFHDIFSDNGDGQQ